MFFQDWKRISKTLFSISITHLIFSDVHTTFKNIARWKQNFFIFGIWKAHNFVKSCKIVGITLLFSAPYRIPWQFTYLTKMKFMSLNFSSSWKIEFKCCEFIYSKRENTPSPSLRKKDGGGPIFAPT